MKSVTFLLNESTVVYIRVAESSVNHDSSGFYEIHITGDGESFDSILPITLNLVDLFVIVPIAVFIIVSILWLLNFQKQMSRSMSVGGYLPPSRYILPEGGPQYEREPDLRTPRLPHKCPTCTADLSDSNVDWTGPLEATCGHCGAVIQAKFERV